MKFIDSRGDLIVRESPFSVEFERCSDGDWYYLKACERILLCKQDPDSIWEAYESLQRAAVEDAARSTPFVNIIWKYDRLLNAFVEVSQDGSK